MSEGESTRSGKIGRLPLGVRHDLNARIREGELSPTLLPWLNGLPEARIILRRDFQDLDISPANLSDWRQGGYQEWLRRRQEIEAKREMAEYCFELAESGKSILDGSASIVGGKLMEVLESVDIQTQKELLAEKPDSLIGLIEGLSMLQGQANNSRRIEQAERKLALETARFERQTAEMFLKFYADKRATDVAGSQESKEVKIEDLRALMFGRRPASGGTK